MTRSFSDTPYVDARAYTHILTIRIGWFDRYVLRTRIISSSATRRYKTPTCFCARARTVFAGFPLLARWHRANHRRLCGSTTVPRAHTGAHTGTHSRVLAYAKGGPKKGHLMRTLAGRRVPVACLRRYRRIPGFALPGFSWSLYPIFCRYYILNYRR